MYIKNIKLENFRNYEKQEISFEKNINIIYGNNAQGKTNIIESIFVCSMGKSFRAKKDKELIKLGKNKAIIEMEYEKKDRQGQIKVDIEDKKIFYSNGVKQNKISDIIGKVNTVIFTPDTIDIIKDDPETRRKFLNMLISSLRPKYIHLMSMYKKSLEQRNNYLKQIKIDNKSANMLEIWDEQLSNLSFSIYEYRKQYIEKFSDRINDIHKKITKSGKPEEIKIKYFSDGKTKEEFYKKLINNRENDIKRGFTSCGIHRDDFKIYINNELVLNYGSQGQQRSAILTLKLTELEIIKEEIGESPVLLLDDFMSELDNYRRTNFLENIKDCQVIITCTDDIKDINSNVNRIYVEEGKCI